MSVAPNSGRIASKNLAPSPSCRPRSIAACALAERKGIEMPIARQMKAVLYEGKAAREALDELMLRSLKRE